MPTSPEVINWAVAARVGRAVGGSGPATTPGLRAQVRADFAEYSRISDELVREFTGLEPVDRAPDPIVLDRGGWVRANIEGFSQMVRPLAEKVAASSAATGLARQVTGAALGLQIGILLGYLSQKVLGQYDLVLAGEGGGRVYYVGPNVLEMESRMGVEPRDFRLWIALHEITHRTQFTGVPWLRERVRTLIERSLGAMDLDPARVRQILERGRDLLMRGPSAWRAANVMDLVLNEQQKQVLDEVQALMTVVEGHGTFVMNRVGRARIEGFERMKDAMDRKRASAKGAERVFQRVIGLDMKYEQYALGERFCDAVADRAGVDAVNRVWERGGDNIPTAQEMRDPEKWLARVGA